MIIFPDRLNIETFLTHRWCTRQFRIQIFRHIYITYKKITSWEPDEIDFEDSYDEADPTDDADLDASMTILNRYEYKKSYETGFVGLNGHQRIKMK